MSKNSNQSKKPVASPQSTRRAPALAAPLPDVSKKPAPNKAKPPRPAKKQDVEDIDRADSEGMAQPQGLPPKKKKPAAALGRMGDKKGSKVQAPKLPAGKGKATTKSSAKRR